ncbi:MAG: hypothetical protein WC421_11085 [Elusimicrobiales bacterium]
MNTEKENSHRPPMRQMDWFLNYCMSFACTIAHACSLLDFRLPEYIRGISEIAKPSKLNPDFEQALERELGDASQDTDIETPIIFVLGEWGSGKTFQLLSYRNKSAKNGVNIEYCSFWGVHTVQEALLHTIPPRKRLSAFVLLLALLLASYLSGITQALLSSNLTILSIALTLFFAILLISARWKIIYTVMAMFTTKLDVVGQQRIVVLDDLERSGLNQSEQWRLLLSLWKCNTQYIIPIGYGMGQSDYEWRDMAAKLHGKVIELPVSNAAKFELLKKEGPKFLYRYEGWIDYLTPRDIIAIVQRWYEFQDGWQIPLLPEILAIKLIRDKLFDKLGISMERRETISAASYGFDIRLGGPDFTTTEKHHFNTASVALFSSLGDDVRKEISVCLAQANLAQILIWCKPEEAVKLLQNHQLPRG